MPGPEYEAWIDQRLDAADEAPAVEGPAPDFKIVPDCPERDLFESLSRPGPGIGWSRPSCGCASSASSRPSAP